MPSKTKAVKSSARKSTSVSQTLMNQRLVIWLLVGFVAFLTLWMLYTVKAMQASSMGTKTEAAANPLDVNQSCTPSDRRRGQILTFKKGGTGRTNVRAVTCCKKKGTSQYYWVDSSNTYGNACPGERGFVATDNGLQVTLVPANPTSKYTRPTGIALPTSGYPRE